MKCPNCGFENIDEAKFCNECGNKFEIICPDCNTSNQPGSKFCYECGHNLTQPPESTPIELSFDEKIEKIQKYLPQGLTNKILSQRDKIEGERKQVTVMFCDMEGFTPLVEKIGPEEAYSIMDEVYEILIHKVHEYEGTVNEMTGDGIMALFGAPIALEDAPQRAIRSAYAIHREMTRFSDKMKQEKEGIPPLKMRIGINTGPVVVGTLGNDLRVEFKAIGDTVNLASRMEDLAEPGATYVTEETFKLTEGLFRYESLGEKEVKGKKESVKAYRVIGPSTRRTRFDVSAERGLTPFVGRERELELLLDGFERAKAARGQAFSIMAEAGVGKSRLLYEFRKAVENEDVTFLEGKCLSYSRGVAYHPIIDLYKSNFDIRESEEDNQIKDKVKRGLKQLDVEESSVLPYLLELLSVKDSGIDQIPMSPEGRKDRMIENMIRIPLKGSEIQSLILAIEDLHWMDKSSEEALKYLLESISGARILLIFTYRPEFVHTWGGRSYHNQVTLNRLSNRESLSMVNYLLGTKDIESDLENLILEKTEGVPFFIEEFIKSLKDLNVIERKDNRYNLIKNIQDLVIPSTIQDVIMARVDSLPERAKEILQAGSVIEREFGYELIKQVMSISNEDLLSYLSALKDSELLYERGIFPKSTYIFKHALTREVVYDSILTRTKKKLHEDIGNTIEDLYNENISEHYAVLADHYIEAESYEKGAEYSRLANRKAEKTVSLNDAVVYARKRVACIERLFQTEEVEKKLIEARTALGLYAININLHSEAKEAVSPIIDLAIKRDYKRMLARIYTILGTYYTVSEQNYPMAFQHFEEAIKLSEDVQDIVSSVLASAWFGIALANHCEFEKAAYYIEKAIEINEAANALWGIAAMKSHLSVLVYGFQGKVNAGYKVSAEAVRIAEESGDPYSKGMAYTAYGVSLFFKRSLEEAIKNLLTGATFCERTSILAWDTMAHYFLGEIFFEMAEYQKSKNHYNQVIEIQEQNRLSLLLNLSQIQLATTKVMNNEKDIDLESFYRIGNDDKTKANNGQLRRCVGKILLNIDDQHITEAEEWIKKAIEADNKNGMKWHLGHDYALYAELFKRKGDQKKAKESLNKAIEILKECGADGWVKKYEKELAALT
jgi:predicted ATPase/class 3 adenylate cyclase